MTSTTYYQGDMPQLWNNWLVYSCKKQRKICNPNHPNSKPWPTPQCHDNKYSRLHSDIRGWPETTLLALPLMNHCNNHPNAVKYCRGSTLQQQPMSCQPLQQCHFQQLKKHLKLRNPSFQQQINSILPQDSISSTLSPKRLLTTSQRKHGEDQWYRHLENFTIIIRSLTMHLWISSKSVCRPSSWSPKKASPATSDSSKTPSRKKSGPSASEKNSATWHKMMTSHKPLALTPSL